MGFLDTFLDILKMFLPHFFIEARNVDLSISNQNGTTNLQKNKIKIFFFYKYMHILIFECLGDSFSME